MDSERGAVRAHVYARSWQGLVRSRTAQTRCLRFHEAQEVLRAHPAAHAGNYVVYFSYTPVRISPQLKVNK